MEKKNDGPVPETELKFLAFNAAVASLSTTVNGWPLRVKMVPETDHPPTSQVGPPLIPMCRNTSSQT